MKQYKVKINLEREYIDEKLLKQEITKAIGKCDIDIVQVFEFEYESVNIDGESKMQIGHIEGKNKNGVLKDLKILGYEKVKILEDKKCQ